MDSMLITNPEYLKAMSKISDGQIPENEFDHAVWMCDDWHIRYAIEQKYQNELGKKYRCKIGYGWSRRNPDARYLIQFKESADEFKKLIA